MRYKYKVGDFVRIVKGTDIKRIGFDSDKELTTEAAKKVFNGIKDALTSSDLLIVEDTPGHERWGDKELDGQPTYTVIIPGKPKYELMRLIGIRVPESLIELIV